MGREVTIEAGKRSPLSPPAAQWPAGRETVPAGFSEAECPFLGIAASSERTHFVHMEEGAPPPAVSSHWTCVHVPRPDLLNLLRGTALTVARVSLTRV